MDSNILLESGTNELEVLEFIINGNHYGINVEKVREILPYQEITPVPNSHPCIEGIFMPRGDIITFPGYAISVHPSNGWRYRVPLLLRNFWTSQPSYRLQKQPNSTATVPI